MDTRSSNISDPAPAAAPASPARRGDAVGITNRWGKATRSVEEGKFLQGPKKRSFELLFAVRVFLEMVRAFRALHFIGPCVTVFGSARFPEDHPYYILAREVSARIAQLGFTIMTGGGPGIMEAANRGARDVAGRSVGCNIMLPMEQKPNPYLDRFLEFKYFFVRKVMLVKYSYAFVVLPGGFGTMDELFEAATLVQTGKIQDFPIILMGREFWQPLLDFVRDRMAAEGTVSPVDMAVFFLTDSPEEALDKITDCAVRQFGFRWKDRPRRRWFLFENGGGGWTSRLADTLVERARIGEARPGPASDPPGRAGP